MKKAYEKPEVELVSLMAAEAITTAELHDFVGGNMSLEDAEEGW